MSSKSGRFRTCVIGLASALAAALFFSVPVTGASLFASQAANVHVGTPEFGVELLDEGGVLPLSLSYPGIVPGVTVVDQFLVKNVGQVDGRVTFGGLRLAPEALLGLTPEQASALTMSIDGYQETIPVLAFDRRVDLGVLRAGESRIYALRIGLSRDAGSQWQHRALSLGGVEVTLQQR